MTKKVRLLDSHGGFVADIELPTSSEPESIVWAHRVFNRNSPGRYFESASVWWAH